MKNLNEQLNAHMGEFRLSSAEKERMRMAIEEHMLAHPLGIGARPWQRWMGMHRFALPALAAVLLCTSTAYAAQGALPGDLLYPVKIHVTEPVEVALATSPSAKATVEAKLATRRVEEAQTLALRGALTATTTKELQDSFNEHASEALALSSQGEDHTEDTAPDTTTNTSDKPVATMAVHATLTAPASMATEATTTSTSTVRAAAKTLRASKLKEVRENQSSQLKASLDIQANILDTLEVQVKERDTKQEDKSGSDEKEHSDSQ